MKYRIHHQELDSVKLEEEAKAILESLKSDEELRGKASAAGVDLDEYDKAIGNISDEPSIKVDPEDAGVAPGVIEIALIFAPVAAKILQDCWTHFILPRLKEKWGADSIEEIDEG